MSQVTEQSVRFQTALASIKLIQASAVLDLTEDDFDFMTSKKDWIDTDRYRDRCCIEPCMYGALDCVGFFFSSRSRHTICSRDWSSDVCSSDLSRRCRRLARHPQRRESAAAHDAAGLALTLRPDRVDRLGRITSRQPRRGVSPDGAIRGYPLEIGRASCRERV